MSVRLRDVIKEEVIEELIVNELLDSLDCCVDSPHLLHAMNTVIAYYSVPGEYENGKYDNYDTSET